MKFSEVYYRIKVSVPQLIGTWEGCEQCLRRCEVNKKESHSFNLIRLADEIVSAEEVTTLGRREYAQFDNRHQKRPSSCKNSMKANLLHMHKNGQVGLASVKVERFRYSSKVTVRPKISGVIFWFYHKMLLVSLRAGPLPGRSQWEKAQEKARTTTLLRTRDEKSMNGYS